MKKISLIGGGVVSSNFIKEIVDSDYELQYFFPSSKFDDFNKSCITICQEMKINITYEIKDLCESDLIISAGNHKILDEFIIKKKFVMNFHAAPLPKYGGSAGPSFSLINDEEVFGCTFQKMVSDLDAGPIINQYSFKIK